MKAILKNPWFIGGLGMLALSLFIYFIGPFISIGNFTPLAGTITRLVTIGVLILFWVIFRLVRQIRAKRAAEQISAGIVEAESTTSDDDERSAEEVATLKARFEEAVEVLRKTGGSKNKSLYELPWYMIIGPPGAGKTTALVNSGLRFPLSDRFGEGALRGVGGTRNCDWWFTDEAILLDTAGRYTTQDSQATVDRAAWEGFLELLKKYRKRRPINGVLVAISASDFMTMDAAQRRENASAIRHRIHELDEFFGMRFPVYVLVTKCDLINGFVDFFDDLGQREREQVWGVTLPLPDDAGAAQTGKQLDSELDALFARLDEQMLPRLHHERDLKRRGQIHSFPRQIYGLKAHLVEFLEDVFRSSRFEESALLRGLYFSSATQEGTPIDRVMGSISRTFGLEQQALASFSGQGRSYFLTRLLKQVIFQEAGIAGTNQKVERRRAWLQRVAYAGVFVVVGLLLVGWTISFFGNQQIIASTETGAMLAETKLAEVPRHRHEPETTLEALNALRDIVADRESEGSPMFVGLGLYQGDTLQEQAQAAYRRALVNQLLPRVMLRLEQQVDQAGQPLDYTYEALKTYLRFGSDKRYDAEAIGAWVTLYWQAQLPREIGAENYKALTGHLSELLKERPAQLPLPMDESVIRRARQKLMRIPLEERIYARLKGSQLVSSIPGFNVFEQAGPDSLRVFVRDSGRPLNEGIPGFFTRRGYRLIFSNTDSYKLVQELSSEQWVLRDEADLKAGQDIADLMVNLRELYYADYVSQYKDLVYDIELAPFKDARDAASILNVLSRPTDSPLTNLINAVQRETNLSGSDADEEGAQSEGDDAFAAQRQALQQRLGNQVRTPRIAYNAKKYANIVEAEFAEFQDLTASGDGMVSPISHLVGLLRELADYMMMYSSEESADGVPAHVAQRGLASLQRVQFEAERQDLQFLKALLADAALSVSNIASGGVAKNIETQWQSGPLLFCQRAVSGRYPIDGSQRSEIRLEDFGRFFGYGGDADKFFEAYLKDKIDTSRKPWRARESRGVQISMNAITQFERAQAIKDTFFRGDTTPYVGFELTPITMDPTITQFSLSINGHSIRYAHGPIVAESFNWPGPLGVGEIRMEMSPGNGTPMRLERGPWSLFRVLDEAKMRPGNQPEHFEVDFELGGRTATYQLVARSAYNPFKFEELSKFRCPETLTR